MSLGRAIKELSHKIANTHNKQGVSMFCLDGTPAKVLSEEIPSLKLVTVTYDHEEARIPGKAIFPKEIRKFLFDFRGDRRLARAEAVIVTAYDKEKNISYIGLAAFTGDEAAQRFIRRRPTMAELETI